MNPLFRSALLAAMVVLPTAAFAQSAVNVTETQVEMIAYEPVGPDLATAPVRTNTASGHVGAFSGAVADTGFNPADNVGLKSIYVSH
jgi:hypothetical protein